MDHLQQALEEPERRLIGLGVNRRTVGRFHKFEIPGAEIVPEELVRSHQRVRNPELREMVVHFRRYGVELVAEPSDCHLASLALFK